MKRTLILNLALWCLTFVLGTAANYQVQKEGAYHVNAYAQTVPEPTPISDPYLSQRQNLQQWFNSYDCPLGEYTDQFIEAAAANGLDYRLLPAMSFKESTCGKHYIWNNPFGFGCSSTDACYRFNSFSDAIAYVAKSISGSGSDGNHYQWAKKDSAKILYTYNGRVKPSYPQDVIAIMDEIEKHGQQIAANIK